MQFTAQHDGDLSLRDYFAGQALHAAADAICDDLSDGSGEKAADHADRHAKAAYLLADAMISARQGGPQE